METEQDSCLFEGQRDNSAPVRYEGIEATGGREGSARGKVEKTEDFGQGQPENEIRGQGWPSRGGSRGVTITSVSPVGNISGSRPIGAGDGNGQPDHPVQG